MTKLNSEYFYDPMRAVYDGGVDYLTKEKHWLVVIAQSAYAKLVNLEYDELLPHYPFSAEDLQNDQNKLIELKKFFEKANEIKIDDKNYCYALNYNEQINKLDDILIKYIEFFESDFYKSIAEERFKAFEQWAKDNPPKEDQYSYF